MQDTDSWMRLKQVAEHRRDVKARELTRLVVERKQMQEKLDLLMQYRNEYQARLASAARTGIRGEGLLNYQRFLANLERAIDQQTQALASLEQNVSQAQDKVTMEHRRRESYDVLGTRRIDAEDRKERKRQQTLQDEMALRSGNAFSSRDDKN